MFVIKSMFQATTGAALKKFKDQFGDEVTYGKLMRHTRVNACPYDSPGGQQQFSSFFRFDLSMKVRKYTCIVYCSVGHGLFQKEDCQK